jgi:hypothetical protein
VRTFRTYSSHIGRSLNARTMTPGMPTVHLVQLRDDGRRVIEGRARCLPSCFLTVHLFGCCLFLSAPRSCLEANGHLIWMHTRPRRRGGLATIKRHVAAFLAEYDTARGELRVDNAGGTDWHADPKGRFQDRSSDWATDQTSFGCESTTDPQFPPPHPTSAAVTADSPIRWRASPPPTSDLPAAVDVGSPIKWRAVALPTTGSAAAPSGDQASGAADGIATSVAPPEPMAPSALADSSDGATDTKKDWLIFYGLFAVLIVVDAMVAWLVQ